MSTQEFQSRLVQVHPMLLGFAYKLTHSEEDAKDLVQDTIYKALNNLERFKPNTNLKAWLFTIMRNTFINIVKRNRVVLADSFDYSLEDNYGTHNESQSLKDQEDIMKKIDDLPEEFKTPFMMHFEGFKYDEIAEKLNIPLSKVKNRIHHARKKLTAQLTEFQYA